MEDFVRELVSTGVDGLDTVLRGGLPHGRLYLIQGSVGTGKTTLGLQFAVAGVRAGERCLFVAFSESEPEIRAIAESHGWPADALPTFYQRSVSEEEACAQTVLHPAEVELPAALDSLLEQVERFRPDRLVLDSLAELRILAQEPRYFRRELVRLRDRLSALGCTVLLLDTEMTASVAEALLTGVIQLVRRTPGYGPDRRHLQITKIRGHEFETGCHDVRIGRGGMSVFPRLVAAAHRRAVEDATMSTGLAGFDEMLGGGLDRGAAILLLGPTGTGKSSLALQCALAAAERGEKALIYVFDERLHTVFQRARGLGLDLDAHVEAGRIILRQIDPAELTPGEFAEDVRQFLSRDGVRLLLLDSLNAYLYAMPDERFLGLHLHELLAHLSQQGASSIIIASEPGRQGLPRQLDISFLADTVVLMRPIASGGRTLKVLTVYKRRAGPHDDSVRALHLESGRIVVGERLALTPPSFDSPAMPLASDARGGREDET